MPTSNERATPVADAPIGPAYIYRGKVARIIDGDTLLVTTDLGFTVSADVTVRVRGVNAPEHNKPGGAEATAFLKQLLADQPLLVQSYRDRQSFARWVCDLWTANDRLLVADQIIAAGHGVAIP